MCDSRAARCLLANGDARLVGSALHSQSKPVCRTLIDPTPADARNATLRRALRGAILAIERVDGNLRRSAQVEGGDVWKALVSGRWLLVDSFDHAGARYYVAHRKVPQAATAARMSEREALVARYIAMGRSNRLIAYELGIGVSSIGTYVRRVCKKLGVSSRAALIRALAEGPGGPGENGNE